MTTPRVDDPEKEWCFLVKSTTVIGLPFQPDVTQVTYDGSLYTGQAELCFFYGRTPEQPIYARQKTFFEGWMPLVEDSWTDGAVSYDYEAFAQKLPGEDASNTVNFIRIRMTNKGISPAIGFIYAATRHRLDESRFGGTEFNPKWKYSTTETEAFRDDQLIYTFPKGGRELGTKREAALSLGHGSSQTAHCLAGYRRELQPGQTVTLVFKMPRVPVAKSNADFIAKLETADYDAMRRQTTGFWQKAILGKTEFRIPEARVQNAQRASLVHIMLATRERGGKRFQTDGLPYPDLFLTSNVQAEMAYDFLGRGQLYESSVDEVLRRQGTQGIFMDTSLPQNEEPLIAGQGQTLHALSYHAILSRDQEFAKRVFPAVARGVAWLEAAHKRDPHGLMPPSWPYDNEMIKGRYTSHNLWCLLGVRSAIRLARMLGEEKSASEWTRFEAEYSKAIITALHDSALPDGSVPPGLYDYKTGNAAREGFKEYQTNQDWENMLLAAPTEVLSPGDPLLTATLARLHRTKFREGVMTYRNGQHLHQYITANVMEQEMARGEEAQALTDLYHMLLHNGSTGEGFENLVEPWTRQVNLDCPPPHAWAAMKTALVIRNVLLVERGGKAGLNEKERELHLFSLLSPAWVHAGAEIGFRNAPCEMGSLDASLRFTAHSATLRLDARWRWKPRALVVHIPWFLEVTNLYSDGSIKRIQDDLELSPNTRRVTFSWKVRPGAFKNSLQNILLAYRREPDFKVVHGEAIIIPGHEGVLSADESVLPDTPLSFAAVLDCYRSEYNRRFKKFISQGGVPVIPILPVLQGQE